MTELLSTNGGDKFMQDLGRAVGMIGAGIYSFMLGVRDGGYANCKCS